MPPWRRCLARPRRRSNGTPRSPAPAACRRNSRSRASRISFPSAPARVASGSRPAPSISRWRCPNWGPAPASSTPQDVATADVARAIQMFNTLKVPNLGLVENMSYFECPHCGEREDIFGHGGARALAERMKIPFLGEIPLDRRIREGGGPGVPLMVHEPDSPLARVYRDVASHLAAQVSIRNFKQASVIPLRTI